ncbi:MAG: hypothetical protein CHACPFDD_00995 [Phycisphaerae bacterium]|nr:hypothetical protein [Phycisphaerae bacterium]
MPDETPQAVQAEANASSNEVAAPQGSPAGGPADAAVAAAPGPQNAPAAGAPEADSSATSAAGAPPAGGAESPASAPPAAADALLASQEELNAALGTAQQAVASAADAVQQVEREVAGVVGGVGGTAAPRDARPLPLPEFDARAAASPAGGIELLDDVELHVKIELGRTEMYVEDVLKLGVGSVVELDKLAGDPVDIFVNDRLIGRGEVLVLNDNFCVRVNELLSTIAE